VATLDLRHLWPADAVELPTPPSLPTHTASASAPAPRYSGGRIPERKFLPEGVPLDLASLERLAIQEALRRLNGNRTHAARLLGISLRTLRNKLREFRIRAASADGQLVPGNNPARESEDATVEGSTVEGASLACGSHSDAVDEEQAA
jgi:hypothetical protein